MGINIPLIFIKDFILTRIINHYRYDGSKIFTWNAILVGFLFLLIIGLTACGDQSEDYISSETPAATEPVAATKPESNQNSTSQEPGLLSEKPGTKNPVQETSQL